MLTEAAVDRCLREHWGLPASRLTPLHGGMGSRTWVVDQEDRRWVAKAVAAALGGQFEGGLRVAQRLERAGIPAGEPAPTRDGSLAFTIDGHRLALLAWVPGNELTGHDRHQRRLIGATLAQVHRALAGQTVEGAQRFH